MIIVMVMMRNADEGLSLVAAHVGSCRPIGLSLRRLARAGVSH